MPPRKALCVAAVSCGRTPPTSHRLNSVLHAYMTHHMTALSQQTYNYEERYFNTLCTSLRSGSQRIRSQLSTLQTGVGDVYLLTEAASSCGGEGRGRKEHCRMSKPRALEQILPRNHRTHYGWSYLCLDEVHVCALSCVTGVQRCVS